MYANQVYTGVGGDKFGIHWSMEDVAVVCQRSKLEQKTCVPIFSKAEFDCARPYEAATLVQPADVSMQFSD